MPRPSRQKVYFGEKSKSIGVSPSLTKLKGSRRNEPNTSSQELFTGEETVAKYRAKMALMENGDNRPRRNKLTQSVAVKKQQKTEHVTINVSQEGSTSSLPRITNSPIRIKNKVYTVIDKFHKPIYKKEKLL